MKKILLKDLADELGISISQVSRALNQQPDVAAEIRTRVLELAREKNYRNFSGKHKKTVAVIVSWFEEFNDAILNEILYQTKKCNWKIIIVPYQSLETLNDQLFDGAIWVSGEHIAMTWHEYYNIPLVVINNFGSYLNQISSVFPDADGEVRLAMEHFISLGHTHIARIRGSGSSFEPELQRGLSQFYQIAENYGIRDTVCNYFCQTIEDFINQIITLSQQGYTAFLVVLGAKAPFILKELRKAGIRVPQDISLITYEFDSISASLEPALTTLGYDYPHLVSSALEQLNNEMNGEDIVPQIVIPTHLNIRESTSSRKIRIDV